MVICDRVFTTIETGVSENVGERPEIHGLPGMLILLQCTCNIYIYVYIYIYIYSCIYIYKVMPLQLKVGF